MQLRRTAAMAAIAAMGGLAVLGSAPAATAATPTAQPCKTGLVGITFTGLDGAVLKQGGAPVGSTITLVNKTGHDLPEFAAMLLLGPDSSDNPTGGLTVSEKSGGSWHTLSYVKGDPGLIILTGDTRPVDFPAGAKLSYTLDFQAPAGAVKGGYHALALGLDVKSVSADGFKASDPAAAQAIQQQAATVPGGTTGSSSSCTKDWGQAVAAFTVTRGSSKPTPSAPASASPTSKPSTEPVSSVSTSPAAVPSASASSTGPALAETGGGNSTLPIALGGALVVLGAGAVFVTRRRKAARH